MPLGISSDNLCPGIVINPSISGCLYCLWLPFCLTNLHPFTSITRISTLTFKIMTLFCRKDNLSVLIQNRLLDDYFNYHENHHETNIQRLNEIL